MSELSTSKWRSQKLTRIDCILFCGLLGLTPLLVLHSKHLLAQPHLQFFPLAWMLFIALVVMRGHPQEVASKRRIQVAWFVGAFSIPVAVASVIWFSPWLSHCATILLCVAWMLLRLGGNAWHEPLAWSTLLLITLPLPGHFDRGLIQYLQSSSTRSASSLLDLVGTPHLAKGNVLEIRQRDLFVDQACSGVDSLYSLIAIALAITIWQKRNLLASLMTLATVPFWAWLGNLGRILLIAVLLDHFDIDLSHGWQHTLLGLATFTCSFGFLLLTQSGFAELLAPFPTHSVTSNAFHRLYNSIVCWPGDCPTATKRSSSSAKGLGHQSAVPSALITFPRTVLLSIVFLAVGLASSLPLLSIGPWNPNLAQRVVVTEDAVRERIVQSLMPQEIEGMQQVAFGISTHGDYGSLYSATWQYTHDHLLVQISLDFPFEGFHGLEQCYFSIGNRLLSPVEPITIERGGNKELQAFQVRLQDQLGETSHLCYVNVDQNFNSVSSSTLTMNRGAFASAPSAVYQMQIFVASCGELSEHQLKTYHRALSKTVDILTPIAVRLSDTQ